MGGESGGLRGMLRKAASLVVEMPPEQPHEFHADVSPGERASALKELQESQTAWRAQQANRAPATGAGAPAQTGRTVADVVRSQPGPNLEEIRVHPDAAKAVAVDAAGNVDFDAVFKAAGVEPCSLTAEQVLDMINQLPGDLPAASKRQMVKVSITTMGKALNVTPDTVMADASRKLAAIASYAEQQQGLAQELVTKANQAIAEMETRIADHRKTIAAAQDQVQRIQVACKSEADRLDDILEFLTEDVAPSRNAGT